MNQQINLYQPMFRKQEKVFSAVTILQACGVFFLIFTLIYGYGQYQLWPVEKELEFLKKDILTLTDKTEKLEKQFAPKGKSQLLESEIARLNEELSNRKKIQKILQQQSYSGAGGFSGYLEAFARRHVQGTWLTKVNISNGGQYLGLRGKTLSSELVPVYINQLANEELLSGRSFNVMEMSRSEKDKDELNFYVGTN